MSPDQALPSSSLSSPAAGAGASASGASRAPARPAGPPRACRVPGCPVQLTHGFHWSESASL